MQEISYIWHYQFQNNYEWGNTFEEGSLEINGKNISEIAESIDLEGWDFSKIKEIIDKYTVKYIF